MRKLMTLLVATVLVAAVALAGLSCGGETKEAPLQQIKVAVFSPLTGPAAYSGTYLLGGPVDYFEMVNKEGGIDGIQYDVLGLDTRHTMPGALAAYEQAKADGAKAIIMCHTGPTAALRDRLKEDDIVIMDAGLDKAQWDPPSWGVYGMSVPYDWQALAALKALKDEREEKGIKDPAKIAYLAWDHPSGRAHEPQLVKTAEEWGWEVNVIGYYPFAAVDYSSFLTKVDTYEPDYFFFFGTEAQWSPMIKDAIRMGIKDKYPLIIMSQIDCHDRISSHILGNDVTEGIRGVGFCPTTPYQVEVPGLAQMKAFNEDKYGEFFGKGQWGMYALAWNLAVATDQAIRAAIADVGYENLSGDAINDAFLSLESIDTDGIVPPFRYTETKRWGNATVPFGVIKDGEYQILERIDVSEIAPLPQ